MKPILPENPAPPKARPLQALTAFGSVAILLAASATSQAAVSGQWDFENGNLNATAGSKALEYADGPGAETQAATRFGTTTSFGIPNIGGTEAKVMKFGTNTIPAGYAMPAPTVANGGGGQVNQWTLLADVLYPAVSNSRWRAIIECDGGLTPDAEAFVNTSNGFGLGSYGGSVSADAWHRLAIVADTTADTLKFYVDGVQVLSRNAGGASGVDGRWALQTAGVATLFADDNGETAGGYVNSIQLHNVALTKGQVLALGGPSAAGLPATLPPVPSSLENWIPAGATASRTTAIGAVINPGDATIQDSSISLSLDGAAVASPAITRPNGLIRVEKTNPGLSLGKHELVLAFTDSQVGQRRFTNTFDAALFFEDFETVVLGPNKDEGVANDKAWTDDPPAGWTVDNSKFLSTIINDENPDGDGDGYADRDGVTEWAGWSFANREWWAQTAGDQRRTEFTLSTGNAAVADPDEWDDVDHAVTLFNSVMTSPAISIEGLPANTITLQFSSSWRPEGKDDANTAKFPVDENGGAINNQTAVVTASFDGGAPVQLLKWDSISGSPTFHTDMPNESVLISVPNPAGAKKVVLAFSLLDGANDWWWAVDNIALIGSIPAPTISQQPLGATRIIGSSVSFTVVATSTGLSYQWKKGATDITGATNATYTIAATSPADAGQYTVVVTNGSGSVTSNPATLTVLAPPADAGTLKNGLAVYLGFDGNYNDASGNNHNGTAVGTLSFEAGKVGQAVKVSSRRAEQTYNYVTLGANDTLPFGQTKDFTVAFWAKAVRTDGDPSIVANKNWGSGGNTGWTIGTQGDGRIEWNYVRSGNGRKDLDYTGRGNVLNNTNAWAHVVVVWNIAGNAETYVNGELVNSSSIGPATGDPFDAALALNLGQDGTGAYTDGEWDGLLDEVAIWDRSLSTDEVLNLYAFGYFGETLNAPPITSGLTTLLKLDGNYADATASGNNGTAVGTPDFTGGRIGQGAHLRSVRTTTSESFSYITLGNGPEDRFGETQPFSVSFWVKMNEWSGDPSFVSNKDWGAGGNTGWVVATDGDGRLQWNYRRDPLTRKDFDSVGGLFTDKGWHHVVTVFDINGLAVTYFDGNEIVLDRGGAAGRKDISPGTGTLQVASLALNIGQDGTGHYSDSDLFDAVMDDVAFWNRALSGREAAVIYSRGLNNQSADGSQGSAPPPSITYSFAGGQLTLTWSGSGKLQSATSVSGPWAEVAGASSPAKVPTTGTAAFFRVVQ